LYFCIASELRNFSNEYFIKKKTFHHEGPPHSEGPGAIAPVSPP